MPEDRKFVGFDAYEKAMDCLNPDFTLLIYLDRFGVWRLGRELWSGTLFVAIVAVAFLTAYSLSSDASRHLIHLVRGRDIARQQALKRLDQLAGSWKLTGEEHHGEPTVQTESQHGRLFIERPEGLWIDGGGAENGYNMPAYTISLTLAGEERHGKVAVRIGRFTPEYIDIEFENDVHRGGIYRFEYADGALRVKDFNLLTNWSDKAKVRNTLAYEVYRHAGSPYHVAFPPRRLSRA